MATAEYLHRFILEGRRYDDLPARFKLTCSPDDWRRQVKDFCIHRGFAWVSSVANTVCTEYEYYDELMRHYRLKKRLFPYHLCEYVCRIMRMSPFRYYISILADTMREDLPYDSIPNFTAADIVRIVGIGRNEYIATMVQAKSKKLLWRVNKGMVKDLLPQEPLAVAIDPWWLVHVVNVGEAEYRQLDPVELGVCHAAARVGGARFSDLSPTAVSQLYRKGIVWLEVPVRPEDHLSIPPLEGFVSNKTTAAGAVDADPLEGLLYQIFVAASDRVTVAKLASILSVDVPTLTVAISMACRLRFCRKLDPEEGGLPSPSMGVPASASAGSSLGPFAAGTGTAALGGAGVPGSLGGGGGGAAGLSAQLEQLDIDQMLRGPELASADALQDDSTASLSAELAGGAGGGGTGIAFVVDSEVTGYLMMGALTPGCKKHSVTLFEGGRVYGAEVLNELLTELHASVEMTAGFEGEMRNLASYARSLAIVLELLMSCAGGRPIELLRKESVASLPPPAAFRILSHSYGAVLPITTLPFPPLPLALGRPGSPTNYGPTPAAATPWLHLALYAALGSGPRSLVLVAGQRLSRLPEELASASHVLLWPWDCEAARAAQGAPVVAEAQFLLNSLNEYLSKTALLVQPVQLGSACAAPQSLSDAPALVTVDVPLPLPSVSSAGAAPSAAPASTAAACNGGSEGWNPFGEPEAGSKAPAAGQAAAGDGWNPFSTEPASSAPAPSSSSSSVSTTVTGYRLSGEAEQVQLPPGFAAALSRLGLGSALGYVRFMHASQAPPGSAAAAAATSRGQAWLPLQLALGMPMQPCELCEAVCFAARSAGFLDARSRRGQAEGQATLAGVLAHLISAHGGWSAFAVGGKDEDLSSHVDRPARNLLISEAGQVAPIDLGQSLQGLAASA